MFFSPSLLPSLVYISVEISWLTPIETKVYEILSHLFKNYLNNKYNTFQEWGLPIPEENVHVYNASL